jgi:dephospho-CoA kinase
MPFRGKPIVGIVGGIGSGKSFVARLLGDLGCVVIDSDAAAHAVYARPDVQARLVEWFGPGIVVDGVVQRKQIASQVFRDARLRHRLEALIHPLVHAQREQEMTTRANDPTVRAFVWDSPLLIEAGLDRACDQIVFVDTPEDQRLRRVAGRGWDEAELRRREASQVSLEAKRHAATMVVDGTASPITLRGRLDDWLKTLAPAAAR